jgi:DeoR/GlpR family transcriptional regulator of sugar metabolism
MHREKRNPSGRRAELRRLMLAHETVSVEELCAMLSASPATIRRDLSALEAEGTLARTHGGAAMQATRSADQDFAQRELQDVREKQRIAEAVVRMIPPQSTIFMNDGSTIMAVARAIVSTGAELFVATPAVNVATKLAESPAVTSCLLGGFVGTTSLATSGHFTEAMAAQINADFAIISPDAVSVTSGLAFGHPPDASLAQKMMSQSRETIVVATARKLNTRDRVTAAPLSKISKLVTGHPADVKALVAAKLHVIEAR